MSDYTELVKRLRRYVEIERSEHHGAELEAEAADAIEELSKGSEDVVQVVRCKDCKHYKTAYCSMDIWHNTVTIYRAKPNDFCSRGARKEEADNE